MNGREKKGQKPVKVSSKPKATAIIASVPVSNPPPHKQKRSKRNTHEDDEYFSDDDVKSSNGNSVSADDRTYESVLATSLEKLGGKRGSIREDGLTSINTVLTANFVPEFIESSQVTLEEGLKRSINKGSLSEKKLAYKTLSLFAVTGGQAVAESLFKEFGQILKDGFKNSGEDSARASAATAYSVICFIGLIGDLQETTESMKFIEDVIDLKDTKQAKLLLSSLLDGWSLLASSLTTSMLNDKVFARVINKWISLLVHDDSGVKQSVGEALALLFEQQKQAHENFNVLKKYEQLVFVLEELAGDSSRAKATKEMKKNRSNFKIITSSIIDGDVPKESFLINKQSVNIEGWKKIIQLNSLRDVLAGGFHTHFVENDILHRIFNTRIAKITANNGKDTERMVIAPSSAIAKERSKKLRKDRGDRNNVIAGHEE